ncbi:Hypothetical predicted protein [Paramuricea clavata]|uniref:Uncharacterized protein n=1 Tax=Paramuricea clavata TaxID=317549 RepID=A0A6S7HDM4_PARCT|nr:Hypothetical predicted protein [Paramuricea clavata]
MATNSSDMGESQPSATGASGAPIDWAVAFESPEFLSGLQTALGGVANSTLPRPDHLEQLGDSIPSQPTTSSASAPGNLSVAQGMFHVSVAEVSSSLLPPRPSLSVFNPTDDIPSVTPAPNIIQTLNLGPEENAFSLGVGRAPIPRMLVSKILSNQFIELTELLPKNLGSSASDLDILSWTECFITYILVMITFRPHRAHDLLEYMALIIRTAERFDGRAWSQYDRAFRREAEVSNLKDWSVVRTDLYNFHTSAINRRVNFESTGAMPRAGPMAL